MKYKVGDIVKTEFGIGSIVEIIDNSLQPYLVYHDNWNGGHNGENIAKGNYEGDHCWWFYENELEFVEFNTTEINVSAEYKPMPIKFNIMPDRYIINKGATILFWGDGTKTIVKRSENDAYDKRLGFLTAYFQKTSGMSKTKANKYLDDLVEEDKKVRKILNPIIERADDTIDVLKYALREIKPKFKAGDKVKIINTGKLYTAYEDWFIENNCKELLKDYKCQFSITKNYINKNKIYKIIAIGKHGITDDILLAIKPLRSKTIFLINEKGVKKA